MRLVGQIALAALLLSAGLLPGARAEAQDRPVVVELFTSQGCNSCPPADAFLDELGDREGIIALSLHVDYWDYIGWRDPFADPAYTERQRDYEKRLDNRFIYTPQMVVDGRIDVVGSRREKVERAIARASEQQKLSIEVSPSSVTIPAGPAPRSGATVWLALLDRKHETPVGTGENRGRKLVNRNVVRSLTQIGIWNGEALTLPLDAEGALAQGRYACAILVQADGTGPILGAALVEF